jgi:hypothetical protein
MHRALALVAIFCCLLTGCIERRPAIHLRFDEQADVLQILHVHTHIFGHDKSERNWLVKQWEWRDRLIPTVRVLGYIAYLRHSNDSYQQIDLDSPSANDAPIQKTDLPLGGIVIRPGELFLGPENALAYTHQVDLPGKTFDALLQRALKASRDEWKKGIAAERERRSSGGKVFAWEECRELLLRGVNSWGIDAPPVELPDDQRATPERCLSDESLRKLEAALDGKNILSREGSLLTLSLPLNETDRGQVISIYGEVHERAMSKFKAKELPKEMQRLVDDDFLAFAREINVQPGVDDLVILSCRLPRRFALLTDPSDAPPSEEEAALQRETVAAIKAAGIPVRSDVKLDDIVAKFRGGP